jgi:hypothetical protein
MSLPTTNNVTMSLVQLTNATTAPVGIPTVTNKGLPCGDNQALSPPVTITGNLVGFGDFAGLTLVYFGYDETQQTWSTAADWAAQVVTATGAYAASVSLASDAFAAVVMTTAYWNSYIASHAPSGGLAVVGALPSPTASPGQVVYSAPVAPGSGRTITYTVQPYPNVDFSQGTLTPGQVFPIDMSPLSLSVFAKDTNPQQSLDPTSSEFISNLLYGTPYGPKKMAQPLPSLQSLNTLTVVGQPPSGVTSPGGYLCIMLYQDGNGSLYLLAAAAGPAGVDTQGMVLWEGTPNDSVAIGLMAVVTLFSSSIVFNVVSASAKVSRSALGLFDQGLIDFEKDAAKDVFGAVLV